MHGACASARPGHATLLACASLLGALLPGAGVPAADFPKRRAGLWEVRSTAAAASGLAPTRLCVGEHTDDEASQLDRATGRRGACEFGPFQRASGAWVAQSVCKEARSVVTSRAVATGNFITRYRIDTLVSYDPPLAGIKREDREAVEARWLGPCTGDQRPGDLVMPGVGTLNLDDGRFRPEPGLAATENPRKGRP